VHITTQPREIAARWIRPGDEIATYEVEDGSGEADSGLRDFIRTVEFAERYTTPDWLLVVAGPSLVPPQADEDVPRVEGVVKHTNGGAFDLVPKSRGFVPHDIDHVGAISFLLVQVRAGKVSAPRLYFAKDTEQFVIRERVKVNPRDRFLITYQENGRAARAETEGQRDSAGFTVAAIAKCLNPWHATAPARAGILCPECPSTDAPAGAIAFQRWAGWEPRETPRVDPADTYLRLVKEATPDDEPAALPVPPDVEGHTVGRVLAEASVGDYTRENTEQ